MYNQRQDAFNEFRELVSTILAKIRGVNQSRRKFMSHIFLLFMGLRGRYNFLNMERYGNYAEKSYRNQFSKKFDFMAFNKELVKQRCRGHLIIAFDPSYIPKSGKETDHIGWFWSGTEGKAKKGLEIGGLAAIDVKNNTAMALEAIQTPNTKELESKGLNLIGHYTRLILQRKAHLEELSSYLVVDGYFAKENFICPVLAGTQLHCISKLRRDANLWYPFKGKRNREAGRPRIYTSKVDVEHIDKRRFVCCYKNKDVRVYEAIVYSKMLQRKIKIAYVERWEKGSYTGQYVILFSTDLTLKGRLIYRYYKSRYQIEFLYRDAKQHCGLTHCQAREEQRMYFHFNTSLTTVSIAKAIYYLDVKKSVKRVFSMSDIKTLYLNKLIADRIFVNLAAGLNKQKLNALYRDTLLLGCKWARAA